MRAFGRARGASRGLTALLPFILILAGCSSSPSPASQTSTTKAAKPLQITPLPAVVVAMATPQADGTAWILSGSQGVRTLSRVELSGGKILKQVGVSAAASSIAESTSGILVMGLGTATAGAVDFLNPETAAVTSVVPVAAPVLRIRLGPNASSFWVLDGTPGAKSAQLVTEPGSAGTPTSLPAQTQDIAADSTGGYLWVLLADGTVEELGSLGSSVSSEFSVGTPATALTVTPDGSRLYVLQAAHGTVVAVSEVLVSNQTVKGVLPAPQDTTDLEMAQNAAFLFDLVSGTASNVQAFPISG